MVVFVLSAPAAEDLESQHGCSQKNQRRGLRDGRRSLNYASRGVKLPHDAGASIRQIKGEDLVGEVVECVIGAVHV
jgi:hypothetical protein